MLKNIAAMTTIWPGWTNPAVRESEGNLHEALDWATRALEVNSADGTRAEAQPKLEAPSTLVRVGVAGGDILLLLSSLAPALYLVYPKPFSHRQGPLYGSTLTFEADRHMI